MSGKIIYTPPREHRCEVLDPIGSPYSFAPIGSVYECECGKTWVAKKSLYSNILSRHWVEESSRARRYRKRAAKRGEESSGEAETG